MDEGRKFLRYVVPGLVLAIESILVIWLMVPSLVQEGFREIAKIGDIGLVASAFLVSGGVGYILGSIHHFLHWCIPDNQVDLRDLFSDMQSRGVTKYIKRNGSPGEPRISQFRAWSMAMSLWHERHNENCKEILGAEKRLMSLADLMHSAGTARVAAVIAAITGFAIVAVNASWSFEFWHVVRFVCGLLAALLFCLVHEVAYIQTGRALSEVLGQILESVLVKEKPKGKPIEIRVSEDRKCWWSRCLTGHSS